MTLETIGWIGSILFAICGLPQAISCIKTGHARGLDWGFLLAWTLGEIFTLIYIWPKSDWPLIFNYSLNLMFLCVILRYKIFERSEFQESNIPLGRTITN